MSGSSKAGVAAFHLFHLTSYLSRLGLVGDSICYLISWKSTSGFLHTLSGPHSRLQVPSWGQLPVKRSARPPLARQASFRRDGYSMFYKRSTEIRIYWSRSWMTSMEVAITKW